MTQTEFLTAWDAVPRGCSYAEHDGIGVFTLPTWETLGVHHGFSARTGGVSRGCFSSLNLSFSREEENRKNVVQNYRIFCRAAGIIESSMVMDSFAHGTVVRRVDAVDAGRGYTRPPLPPCDALITDDASVTLVTGHADCMAFYAVDPVRRCIGLAHAGWRGTLARIGSELVNGLCTAFGSDPANLYVGIGPSICPACFEVDFDVADRFTAAFPDTPCVSRDDVCAKAHVDLWMAAFRQFIDAGVAAERFSLMDRCTVEDERLYSHRRDHGNTGGMAAFLSLSSD